MRLSEHYTPGRVNGAAPRRRRPATAPSVTDLFGSMKQGWERKNLRYRAARPSKHNSTRQADLGGVADSHYVWGVDYWRMREQARQLDRDFPIIGQAVDRNLDNLLGAGLRWDPQTEDAGWNKRAKRFLDAWADDAEACDFTGRFTFDEIERLAFRHQDVDGDAFVILDEASGSVRLEEGDRVTSASSRFQADNGNDLILGVELDAGTGRPVRYHFAKRRPAGRRLVERYQGALGDSETIPLDADEVIHLYDPKRATQNRGVTAFHAVFGRAAMADDIEFAELVKHEVASCIAMFLESEYRFPFGPRNTEADADGNELDFDEFRPGMFVRLPPGAKANTFSPRVTTGDSREQLKQIIREIGLSLGMPLELTMLTTSDTTFHGYRGVVEAYKTTARVRRARFGKRLRSRVYRWKIDHLIDQGLLTDRPDKYAHVLHAPAWAYVDPEKDAQADALRIAEHLASPRQVWSERGRDYEQGVIEIVEDAAAKILAAEEQAEALREAGIKDVTWRDVLGVGEGAPAASPVVADESEAQDEGEEGTE